MNCKAIALLVVSAALAGCTMASETGRLEDTSLGEAKAMTMAAQVIDPDPQYEFLDPATSGQHAAAAIDRYRKDAVKKPERVSSRQSPGGN